MLDESWVDEEVDRPDSEESDRTVTAEAIASDPQATWLVALLLALVAIGGFYLMRPSSRPPAARRAGTIEYVIEIGQPWPASIWLCM